MKIDDGILDILQTAARNVAELEFQTVPVVCAPDTVLVGDDSFLDSMGFINFVVAVEDSIARDFGVEINLTEELEKGLSDKQSNLTIGDLSSFLTDLVLERTNR